MFTGFDPSRAPEPYFQRHRGSALSAAIAVHILVALLIVWIEMHRGDEEILDAALVEPEIENLDIEVEEEEELEVEEEPEPEPEPEKPKPKPRQELQNVKQQTQDVSESDVAREREPEPETEPEPEPEPEKAEPEPEKVEPEKPKKKKPTVDVGDREKPRAMPADGTPPKPEKGNKAPAYPESLRKQNITGVIKVKLNIHMDGSVRGMKVLAKNVSGTDDPEMEARAQKLFLKAVVAAVKTWTFKPAKLKGKTITVWWPVTIPFSLN